MITSTLHAKMLKPALASLIVVSSLAFSSCQDEDFGFTKDEIRDSVYDRNFIATFGEIDPNQSWDLSSYATQKTSTVMGASTRSFSGGSELNSEFLEVNASSFFTTSGDNPVMEYQSEWFDIPQNMLDAFNNVLVEGQNNIDNPQLKNPESKNQVGFSFTVESDDEEFYFIPVYQGKSGIASDLHMVVKDPSGNVVADKRIWNKSERIQKIAKDSVCWKNLDGIMDYFTLDPYAANTTDAQAIHSQPIKFHLTGKKGYNVSFYLFITVGHLNFSTQNGAEHDQKTPGAASSEANLTFTGMKVPSTSEKFCVLDPNIFSLTKDITDRFNCSTAFMIGCEDAISRNDRGPFERILSSGTETFNLNTSYTTSHSGDNATKTIDHFDGDDDLNDLVFLVLARNLSVKPRTEVIKKRYLCEDMGSVVDWDFNDIVFDVYQETTTTGSETTVKQYAYLRHRCGTTPFQVKIGGKVLNFSGLTGSDGFVQGLQNDRLDSELRDAAYVDLSTFAYSNPWNPSANNVSITVIPRDIYENKLNDKNSTTVNTEYIYHNYAKETAFPRAGDVPRIIAVDTDFGWTREDVNIESSSWDYHKVAVAIEGVNSVSVDGCSVDGLLNVDQQTPNVGKYMKGSTNKTAKLTAIGTSTRQFSHWEGNGITDANKYNATIELSVNSNMSVTAKFIDVSPVAKRGNYTLSWATNGSGSVTAVKAGNEVTSGSTITKGDLVTLTATPGSGQGFLYWKDNTGKIDRHKSIEVGGSNLSVTAYFRPVHTLTLKLSQADIDAGEKDHVTFTINGETKKPDADGKVQFSVCEDDDQLLVYAKTDRVWQNENVHFVYGESYAMSGKNVAENSMANTPKNINFAHLKTMPSSDVNVPVDVLYRVRAVRGYYEGSNWRSEDDDAYKSEAIKRGKVTVTYTENDEDKTVDSPAYLHLGTTFKLTAVPNSGYDLAKWWDNDNNGYNTYTTNPLADQSIHWGAYSKNADFTATGKLTLNIASLDQSDIASVTVNGETAEVSNGKVVINVGRGKAITIKVTRKTLLNDYDAGNYKYVLSDGSGNVKGTFDHNETTLTATMPWSDATWSLSCLYKIVVFSKTVANNNYSSDATDRGSVTITYNGNDITSDPYVPKNAAFTLTATPKSGYQFTGWYTIHETPVLNSTDNPYSPSHNYYVYTSAVFEPVVSTRTLTVNLPNTNEISYTVSYKDGEGNTLNPSSIESGQSVKISVSASKKDSGNSELMTAGNYSFTWNSTTISGLTTGRAVEQTITMPDNDVSIDLTLMCKITPKVLKKTANNPVEWNAGSVIILNGETDITNDPWVVWNTNVTLQARPIDNGFEFFEWLWNSTNNAERTLWVGQPAAPTVVFKETAATYSVRYYNQPAEILDNDAIKISDDKVLRGLSSTRRTIVLEFNKDNSSTSGVVSLFVPTYAQGNSTSDNNKSLKDNDYSQTNTYLGGKVVVITLTPEEVKKAKDNQSIYLQYYNTGSSSEKVSLVQVFLKPTPTE